MMMKRILLSILIPLTLAAALMPGPSGFCYSEGKFLSDEEMVRRVLTEINSYPPLNRIIYKNRGLISALQIPYESNEKIIEQNKDCCTITKIMWPFNTAVTPLGLFGWIFNNHSFYIEGGIKGIFRMPDGSIIEKVSPIGDNVRIVSSCGQLKD